jgi:hypothetical protein
MSIEMKKIYYLLSTIALMVVVLIIQTPAVFANEFSFSVNPIPSAKQVDKTVTYFDLNLKPKEQETVQVELGNATDKEVVVDISINSAKTNGSGVVEYRPNKLKNTSNLPIDITKIVDFPKQVTIPAKSSQTVSFKISMPDVAFNGLLASGIQFREHGQEAKNQGNKNAVAINNTFSYVLAMLIRENDQTVSPKIVSDKAFMDTQQGRSNVILQLENEAAGYLNKMAIDAHVYYENEKNPVVGLDKKDMQFAPNSIMNYRIGVGSYNVKPGKYTVKGTLYGDKSTLGTYEYNGEKYKYKLAINESFEVSGQKAKELNKKNVLIKKEGPNIWMYLVIGLAILLVLAAGFIIYILKKEKKENEV